MSDHVERNIREWDRWSPDWVEPGRRNWSDAEITWGVIGAAESSLNLLGDVSGADVLELGCGTAYFSSWLMRRGARVTGLDVSAGQLATARLLQREFGLQFPLLRASAEYVPLADASFDLIVSEYGASIWADPYTWVPEASRLLRPGGALVFLVNGVLLNLSMPDGPEVMPASDQLLRPYFGLGRMEWQSDASVSFGLGYGAWIRLLRGNGFEIEDLVELQAPPDLPPNRFNIFTTEWAHQWPAEEIWKARKRA